jgi:hypothetical protein
MRRRAPLPRRARRRCARAGVRSAASRSDRELPRRGAHTLAARLVFDEARDRVDERRLVPRRHRLRHLGLEDLAVAGDVRRHRGSGARERPRQHHAEALLPERRRDERLRGEQRVGQLLLAQEAEDVDPVVGDAQAGEQEAHGERVRARDPEAEAGAPPDLGPGAEEDVEPLARLLAAGEHDAMLAAPDRCGVRREDAVREHLVLAREPPALRVASALGDGDARVEAVGEEAPERAAEPHPAELAGRVKGPDERRPSHEQDGDADRGRHRLVQVQDVEALAV